MSEWRCSGCNALLGVGPMQPNLDRCPHCGARFNNATPFAQHIGEMRDRMENGGAFGGGPASAPPQGPSGGFVPPVVPPSQAAPAPPAPASPAPNSQPQSGGWVFGLLLLAGGGFAVLVVLGLVITGAVLLISSLNRGTPAKRSRRRRD